MCLTHLTQLRFYKAYIPFIGLLRFFAAPHQKFRLGLLRICQLRLCLRFFIVFIGNRPRVPLIFAGDLALYLGFHDYIAVFACFHVLLFLGTGSRPAEPFGECKIAGLSAGHAIVTGSLHLGKFANLGPDCICHRQICLRLAHFNLNLLVTHLIVHLEGVAGERYTHNLVLYNFRHNVTLYSTIVGHKAPNTLL